MRMIGAEFLEQEISKWINCPGDGEYYCGYDNAMTAVLDLIADAPTLTPPNEWVSVEYAMPPELKMVLVYCDGLYDVAGWVRNEAGEVCWTCKTKPQFWMVIPEME